MEDSTDTILNRIQEIYATKGLREEYKNLLGFTNVRSLQNLEEIGRDELFRLDLQVTGKESMHNGLITRPSKKTTVLIIGNHSAGKSSFVNWYIGEKLQSTGVAIETSHFTMITHGEKISELRSEGTMAMYPFLREIMNRSDRNIYGTFFANLNTKISMSKERLFPQVDFIDTPGLTDGNVAYNCDIIEMMKWISNYVDLVLVFLDPVGQALCNKTMDMIEYLNKTHAKKLKICLSKIDQIENERDFNRLNIQIHTGINKRTEQISTEIIPFSIQKESKENYNKINEILEAIEKATKTKALSNIEILTNDCYFILNHTNYLKQLNNKTINKQRFIIFLRVFLLVAIVAVSIQIFGEIETGVKIDKAIAMTVLLGLMILTFVIKIKNFSRNQLMRLENWTNYCNQTLRETEELTNLYFRT